MMNGLSKSWRSLLVLAGTAMTLALAPAASADPGDEVWTTRPLSDASYVVPTGRISSTRALSDASFVPGREAQEISSTRWMSDAGFGPQVELVAVNRVLSDANYFPTAAQPETAPANGTSTGGSTDRSQLPLIFTLLAATAGASALVIASMRGRRRPAI